MAQDDVRRDLKELHEQVEALRDVLSTALGPYRELASYFEQLARVYAEASSVRWTFLRANR